MSKEIKLTDINLTKINPMFHSISWQDKDYSIIDNILKENSNYNDENELEIIMDYYFNDPEKFEELFDYIIYSKNFKIEEIHLIKNSEKWIVFDGNRRISCLKIIENIDKYFKILAEKHSTNNKQCKKNSQDEDELNNSSKNLCLFFDFLSKLKNNKSKNDELKYKLNESIKLEKEEYKIHRDDSLLLELWNNRYKNEIKKTGHKPIPKINFYLHVFLPIKDDMFEKGEYIKNKINNNNNADTNVKEFIKNLNDDDLYKYYKSLFLIIQIFSNISKNQNDINTDIVLKQKINWDEKRILNFPSDVKQILKESMEYFFKHDGKIKKRLKITNVLNLSFDYEKREFKNNENFQMKDIIKFINDLKEKNLLIQDKKITKNNLKERNKIFLENFVNNKNYFEDIVIHISTEQDFWRLLYLCRKDQELIEFLKEYYLENKKNFSPSFEKIKWDEIDSFFSHWDRMIDEINDFIKYTKKEDKNNVLVELYKQIEHNGKPKKLFINAFSSGIRTLVEYIAKLIIVECLYRMDSSDEDEFCKYFNLKKYDVNLNDQQLQKNIKEIFININEENEGTLSGVYKSVINPNKLKNALEYDFFQKSFYNLFDNDYKIDSFAAFLDKYYKNLNIFIHKPYIKNIQLEKIDINDGQKNEILGWFFYNDYNFYTTFTEFIRAINKKRDIFIEKIKKINDIIKK